MKTFFVPFCFWIALFVHADDWPQFLGPKANGTSAEKNLIDAFPEGGPPLVWEKDVGTGYSAPSIRGGTIVLHHRLKNEEIVEAFGASDGKPIWRYTSATTFVDPYGYNNGPRCTPLLTSNRCYTFGAQGKLLCLDLVNGKLVWERDTQKDWEVPEAFFGVGSTPILEGNLLIVMVGGQPNSGVVAFDAGTGKTVWESVGEKNWEGQLMIGWPGERTVDWKRIRHDKQASYATPVAATVNGQRQIFCLMRQGLVSLNPTNGTVNFSYWFRAQVDESVNAANPVVVDDHVLISTAYYRVGSTVLRLLPSNREVEPLWRSTALEIHWTTPIYHDGYLYAFSGRNEPDARFRCVEYKTGKVAWERDERWRPYSGTPNTYGRGSAILADGKLIVLGEGGLLGLFRVNSKSPEELARYQVPQLKHPCWAAPVLSDGKVYLRSENKLLSFDFARK
ncbi:MAG TPA: PQQ-binding-like beta-propeller repeat protein [Verrucomicrobiae bacterium]